MILIYFGAINMGAGLTPISEIGSGFIGLEAKTSGKVIDIYEHDDNHLFLKVKDSSEEVISVPIFAQTRKKLEKRVELLDSIKIKGKIKKYDNNLEIIPNSAESIEIIHVSPVPISCIDKKIGKTVKIKGVVTEKKELQNGVLRLNINKKENSLSIYLPNKTREQKSSNIEIGDLTQFTGKLNSKDNGLALKVKNRRDIKVLEARK